MKNIVLSFLAIGIAAPLMAAELKEKCEGKECPAACAAAKASAFTKVQLKVSDVGCEESCGQLSKTIAGLQGVKSQAVCAQSQTASIEYEAGKTCPKTLTAALLKAGYKVEGQQVSLKVAGMTCGGCAAGLSQALTKLDGVVNNQVCHLSGAAQVLFNPEKVDSKQIVALITKEGYSVQQ